MAALQDHVKLFITQALACFDTPTQVSNAVMEEFGLDVNRIQVQSYDPTRAVGKELGKKYRAIFDETRKLFLDDIGKIPIASQAFRLRALHHSYTFLISDDNHIAAAAILEQAAKEVGGVYTNKLKLADADGNSFKLLMEQFSGGSLPVVNEFEGEFEEVKQIKEVKQVEKTSKWKPK